MADNIKIKGVEANVGINANRSTFANSTIVRIVNTDASNHVLITLRDTSNTVLGSFTIGSSATDFSGECLMKNPSDTIEANTADIAKGAPIGFY